MHLVYIDDSADEALFVIAALAIPVERWRECFNSVVAFRRDLKTSDGIFTRAEFHAWRLVSGRGRLGDRTVSKVRRCEIYGETLRRTAALPGAMLLTAAFPKKKTGWAYERLLTRLNTVMEKASSHALLIFDEGKEAQYTRLVRRLGVYNPIPSKYGVWEATQTATLNIPSTRIIEDPVFKESHRSYFVQLADCAAYALLRQERPIASKSALGLDRAFANLEPICNRAANPKDPQGVIRYSQPGKKSAGPTSATGGGFGPAGFHGTRFRLPRTGPRAQRWFRP